MFHRRSGADSPNLVWRTRLLALGAVLAAAGMASEREWLVNLALGVLIVGFGLRFVGRRRDPDPGDEGGEGES